MAYNPSPKVKAAREIGQRFGKDQVIVLMIDSKHRTLEYASWGSNRLMCVKAKVLADEAYDAVRLRQAMGDISPA